MLKIPAKSRHLNLQNSIKVYYVLAFGAFVSILTFVLYRDIIVTLSMVISTIIGYFLLSRPPKNIVVVLDEDSIVIGENKLKWSNCIAWAMVDLGDTIEFVVQCSDISHQFYYFYLLENQPGLQQLIMQLTQYLPYDESVPKRNILHTGLRRMGLK